MAQLATDQATISQVAQKANIKRVVEDVFTSMLHLQVVELGDAHPPVEPNSLQALIFCSGAWKAELRVIAPPSLSRDIACRMFDMTSDEITEDAVCDALGEISNVIGGNLKGLAEGQSVLSIPSVCNRVEDIPEEAIWSSFNCAGTQFHVVLV